MVPASPGGRVSRNGGKEGLQNGEDEATGGLVNMGECSEEKGEVGCAMESCASVDQFFERKLTKYEGLGSSQ